MRTLKFALPPMRTPNDNRWIISGVGSPTQNFCIGHVDFMLFVLISVALVNQCEPRKWDVLTQNNTYITTPF